MIQVFQLLLSLSILVVLHELGHYLAAKYFGCRVEKFYLFMDWGIGGWDGALFKKKIGETEFGVGWAPLGGYVKISGFIYESLLYSCVGGRFASAKRICDFEHHFEPGAASFQQIS